MAAKARKLPKLPIAAIAVGLGAIFVALIVLTPAAPIRPAIGGPFELTAHDGRVVTEKDFLGRPFLVFFGDTHCRDICHVILFEISEILRALGPQAKVGAMFVTIDPDRDTPEVLKDYLSNFDPRIVGLTGDHQALDPMLRAYRVYAKKAPGKAEDYGVDHTTIVYLMDKSGRFVSTFNVDRQPSDAARELQRHL